MSVKKINIGLVIVLGFLGGFFLPVGLFASTEARETIIYAISPVGKSEYRDYGLIDFNGSKVNLVVFKTQVVGFKDTEKIYSSPDTHLPLRVERDVSMWLHDEYLTEEYFPEKHKLNITKFEGGKKTGEYFYNARGPVHNAVLLPFSLRKAKDLKIGWTLDIRLPAEFKVKLAAIEEVEVPAGKFKAYRFTSTPPKFEVWISADDLRLPIKIKGLGGLSYTLSMKERRVK